jgi:hypothetical protein
MAGDTSCAGSRGASAISIAALEAVKEKQLRIADALEKLAAPRRCSR